MEIYCRIGQKKKEAADYAEQFCKMWDDRCNKQWHEEI